MCHQNVCIRGINLSELSLVLKQSSKQQDEHYYSNEIGYPEVILTHDDRIGYVRDVMGLIESEVSQSKCSNFNSSN